MVSLPDTVFLFENIQDIVPAFGLPAPDILIRHVGCKICQAAAPAATAFFGSIIISHGSLFFQRRHVSRFFTPLIAATGRPLLIERVVSRFLVKFLLLIQDIRFVDLLWPIFRLDLLDGD